MTTEDKRFFERLNFKGDILLDYDNYRFHQQAWREILEGTLKRYRNKECSQQDVKDFFTQLVQRTNLIVPYWYDEDNDKILKLTQDVHEQSKKLVIEAINEMEDESRFSVGGSNSIIWNLVQQVY